MALLHKMFLDDFFLPHTAKISKAFVISYSVLFEYIATEWYLIKCTQRCM